MTHTTLFKHGKLHVLLDSGLELLFLYEFTDKVWADRDATHTCERTKFISNETFALETIQSYACKMLVLSKSGEAHMALSADLQNHCCQDTAC